jgi:hypothetical protein
MNITGLMAIIGLKVIETIGPKIFSLIRMQWSGLYLLVVRTNGYLIIVAGGIDWLVLFWVMVDQLTFGGVNMIVVP